MAVAHRARRCLDQMRRRAKSKGNRIADVEVPHTPSLSLDRLRFGDDIANRVGEAVDSPGDRHGTGISCGHLFILRAASNSGEHEALALLLRRSAKALICL